jgi:hypothetical protein
LAALNGNPTFEHCHIMTGIFPGKRQIGPPASIAAKALGLPRS